MKRGVSILLVVKDLSKKYGEKTVVNNISFTCKPGKVFGLLGRNGAGKTTTLRMVIGIIKKNGGTVTWNGEKLKFDKHKIGYLPEERGLYVKAKVKDQLIYFGKLRGLSKDESVKAIKYWLDRFNIPDYYDVKVDTLSKGNQQKVQLVSALIHDPDIVILDEPFSGLDPVNIQVLKDVIYELKEKGKCVILSSHLMDFIEEFCEDIIVLKEGNAVLNGGLEEIKKEFSHRKFIVQTDREVDSVLKELDFKVLDVVGKRYVVEVKERSELQNLLKKLVLEDIEVNRFELVEPSLHEIFVERAGD